MSERASYGDRRFPKDATKRTLHVIESGEEHLLFTVHEKRPRLGEDHSYVYLDAEQVEGLWQKLGDWLDRQVVETAEAGR